VAYHRQFGLLMDLDMAATDHLSPEQFFHGTVAELRPGSYIRPAAEIGGRTNFPGYDSAGHAYATPSLHKAGEYAQLAQDWAYNGNRRASRRVYEVEPTGHYEQDPTEPLGYQSRSPWRVKRRVPASEWNQ
jgi:hypothetical protein